MTTPRHHLTGQYVSAGDEIATGHPRGTGRVPGATAQSGYVIDQQPRDATASEQVTLRFAPGDHPENSACQGGPGNMRPSVTVAHVDYRSPANVAMARQLAGPVAGMAAVVQPPGHTAPIEPGRPAMVTPPRPPGWGTDFTQHPGGNRALPPLGRS